MTTYGQIRGETAQCVWDMRSHSERNGLSNVRWFTYSAGLVEKARNDVCRSVLGDPNCGWLVFFDGDMQAQPDALMQMLSTAYGSHKHADVIGGYCNLRGDAALPTIDSGSGLWESWFPGSGVVEVMRTGGAFLLVKRHVLEGMKDPWFRIRSPMRVLDAMAEVDNFCLQKFDGKNPFRNLPNAEWERLEQCAMSPGLDGSVPPLPENFVPVECGEDSGFCDRARNAGYRIFVNTDIVTGHIDSRVVSWVDHKKWVQQRELDSRLGAGVME